MIQYTEALLEVLHSETGDGWREGGRRGEGNYMERESLSTGVEVDRRGRGCDFTIVVVFQSLCVFCLRLSCEKRHCSLSKL